MRYFLFGDSIAFGATDYESGGWAHLLCQYLDGKEKRRVFHNLSISGDTTQELLQRIEQEMEMRLRGSSRDDRTIIIAIGINDSRMESGNPKVSEEEFEKNLKEIIKISKNLAGKIIIIGPNPVIEATCNPWKEKGCQYLNERIEKYNDILKEVAEQEEVPFIGVYSAMKKQENFEKLFDDGLHPNREGHKIIFSIIGDYFNE
jgi:acyl-CoA thioesterase I